MGTERKEERFSTKLSSSIKRIEDEKRSFCIIRNISKNGVFLTSALKLFEGQRIECIISFEEQRVMFNGMVRRAHEDEKGNYGYGIQIIEITQENLEILNNFINAGYIPEMEEAQLLNENIIESRDNN